MAEIKLKALRKEYDGKEVVRGIDVDIAHNEFLVLVGPSGCGKSTTLRMIAGLEDISDGEIWIGNRLVNEVPSKDRDIAMVFQNYALYPHMTVAENMSFGLQLRRIDKQEIKKRVKQAAEILNIGDLLDRKPKQLSGGQRQRVAMGRAIVRSPLAFLFDEPLSNLDAKLRVQMRAEIKRIHSRVETTIVYVTHDQVEAMTLADRIVVMNNGRIEQVGSPQELYDQPATRFVASFVGSPAMNFVPCQMIDSGDRLAVKLDQDLQLSVPQDRTDRYRSYVGSNVILGIRPEHITEMRGHERPMQQDISAEVVVTEPMGVDTIVIFRCNGTEVSARVTPRAAVGPGMNMTFTIDMDHMHIIDPSNDQVI